MNLIFGGKNHLALDSTPSLKEKRGTLPKPPILTPSERDSLRQDLKESVEYLRLKLSRSQLGPV